MGRFFLKMGMPLSSLVSLVLIAVALLLILVLTVSFAVVGSDLNDDLGGLDKKVRELKARVEDLEETSDYLYEEKEAAAVGFKGSKVREEREKRKNKLLGL